jgi:hypothetical protein
VLEWVVIVLVVTLAAEVTLGVVFRAAGRALAWYDEVASVLLAWLTFYGAALASVKRAHIGCPELVEIMAVGCAARRQQSQPRSSSSLFSSSSALSARWILPVLHTDALVTSRRFPI